MFTGFHAQCASQHSHITNPPVLPRHNNLGKQPLTGTSPPTHTPVSPLCASHHSHIAPRTTNSPAMRQPPLAHSKRPTPPNTNSLGKRPLAWHRSQPDSSPTRKCASHHWHIAHPPALPQHNNRRKQPIHGMRPATDTPDTRKCASHRSHIAPQITIGPAMCQPPLTHNRPKRHTEPRPKHHTAPPPAMCQPLLAHSQAPTLPNTNNPGKQPLTRHHFQPNSSPTHKCASHRSHITHPPTLPRHNNRRKQPIHGMRPATDTSDIRKCASHRSHIAPQTTISPAMRQPPLAHCAPNRHQPRNVPTPLRTSTPQNRDAHSRRCTCNLIWKGNFDRRQGRPRHRCTPPMRATDADIRPARHLRIMQHPGPPP
ncbi:hypothetical protein CLV65_1274 [Pseudoscardovia suis]|uniref:Uncharacterized protein n=1 Tax=Pseudoscardovia suis TaxID=987063 RepID=A0A261EQH4_9BIFI|nr:hypothetical protein PSSU_1596 [Pseudoscardovia suis]PJJ66022.1 hypothetical protein CLV65_1274 [Pseudoscardovia suis]